MAACWLVGRRGNGCNLAHQTPLYSDYFRLNWCPGLLNHYNGFLAAYDLCENVDEMKGSLEDVEQKTLLALYKNGLGINTKTLSAEARTFLGLR